MGLQRYREKRDFRSTPEPKGKTAKRKQHKRRFVIQKHAASRLHYDFRLELDGVLKSWAVPKGPSLNPSDKRLAVRVEDHPMEYADFEGIIPKGQYGGGSVIVWDHGTWEPENGDPGKELAGGKLKFRLEGEKLHGGWVLVHMKGRGEENWLLIKEKDDEADPKRDIVSDRPESVSSGRMIEEVGKAPDAVWEGGAKRKKKKTAPPAPESSAVKGARKAAMPRALAPQLATLVDEAPQGDRWLFEIKYDGYRILSFVRKGKVELRTRRGHDWTKNFAPIAEAVQRLGLKDAVLDGEVVALDKEGQMSFQALQNVLNTHQTTPLVYYVFDLPYYDGHDLTHAPLIERKRLLDALLQPAKGGAVRYSDHITGDGDTAFTQACKQQLEGLIAKDGASKYLQKRSRSWLKIKCKQRQEFVIGGYTEPRGKRTAFGALVLGYHDDDGKLIYCGRVGTGFDEKTLKAVHAQLEARERKTQPFDTPPPRSEQKDVHWVKPELVAEVEFASWTNDHRVRAPVFLGLRTDKEAGKVMREEPESAPARKSKAPAKRRGKNAAEVAGIQLTHPDKVLYPEQGLTKRALAEYYERMAEHMLPYIAGRPLSTVRCPEGHTKECFYQKHVTDSMPEAIRAVPVEEEKKTRNYISVEDTAGLVALVQIGTLEMHPWGSRKDRLDRPDVMAFDLDPDEAVPWENVVTCARRMHDLLDEVGLVSFLKTSGGKGLHLVVPIERRNTWDEVKGFAKSVAQHLAREEPKRYVATASKARRKGKIYIDYLRNTRGSTAIAPYGSRAKPGAPVATPVRWDELSSSLSPGKYTVENIAQRMAALEEDPWNGYFDLRQSITKAMREAFS